MINNKTVGTSVLSVLLGSLLMFGGVNLFDDDLFYCSDRGILMKCESFSKYYGLPNGKCLNNEVGNKVCRSGWDEVVDDMYEPKEVLLGWHSCCSVSGCWDSNTTCPIDCSVENCSGGNV